MDPILKYTLCSVALIILFKVAQEIHSFSLRKLDISSYDMKVVANFKELCKQMNVGKIPLVIRKSKCIGESFSFNSVICLSSPDEIKFIIAHELSHYTLNHFTKATIFISFLLCFTPQILGFKSFLETYGLTIIMTNVASNIMFLFFETEADLNACKYCTDEEIEQAIEFFERLNKIQISTLGIRFDDFLDYHPYPSTRIKYLRRELTRRKHFYKNTMSAANR